MDAFIDRLDYPLYVVTVAANGERAGCLVGFASQSSIQPVRFTVWLSKENRTFRIAQAADHVGVHLLTTDQHGLAELFGGRTGDDTDKFASVAWTPKHAGVPVLDAATAWFVGRIVERSDSGDHVGLLLDPVEYGATASPSKGIFRLSDASDIAPGHPVG
ncbi:flavin reductase family protein [Streptomyces sp. TRM66268-LWL]|uniref:Flavin reductase family protein n=1 Tax=Streptomyces polyasparticus TaxID=2767826 RepID=A0ABR7SYF7_9ACTN|nr:flavin reductase family protein [Streptomyces polyasparticus]MBC9719710.1 flavin reductase family protein [Streptomyces polyasparticus]